MMAMNFLTGNPFLYHHRIKNEMQSQMDSTPPIAAVEVKFQALTMCLSAGDEESIEFLRVVEGMPVELYSKATIRSLKANSKMWPMLRDISKQVELHGEKHNETIWKYILTAAWGDQYFVTGIAGVPVQIPLETSKLTSKRFSEWIEVLYAYGSEKGVRWSEKSLEAYETYRENV